MKYALIKLVATPLAAKILVKADTINVLTDTSFGFELTCITMSNCDFIKINTNYEGTVKLNAEDLVLGSKEDHCVEEGSHINFVCIPYIGNADLPLPKDKGGSLALSIISSYYILDDMDYDSILLLYETL